MKKYKCHKIVQAAKITNIATVDGATEFTLDDGSQFYEAGGQFAFAQLGGYFVLYDGGYRSYSPAAAFEAGYAELSEVSQVHPESTLPSIPGHKAEPVANTRTKLDDIEQYRMQMAAISCAALGYLGEKPIKLEHDTPALRDVVKLYAKYVRQIKAISAAMNELGVPQPGTPAPVQAAYDHLHRAFYHDIPSAIQPSNYRPAPVHAGLVDLSGLPG